MAQMKTILVEEFGEPEVLQDTDAERPSPVEREALIEVRSAGVNYADTVRQGRRTKGKFSSTRKAEPADSRSKTVSVSRGDQRSTLVGASRKRKGRGSFPRPKT
jgi:hypothetical protein